MTQPPELGLVAEWLRAIDPDPGFLRGLERGYYDIKYAEDNGLTIGRHVVEQWQFLADRARRALDGIDLDGKSLDEVAAAYHDQQIAAHAKTQRALQQRIRALEDGDFEPSAWHAREAEYSGIPLKQVVGEDRHRELYMAEEELARLLEGDVSEEEAEAWWAAEADRTAGHNAIRTGLVRQGHAITGPAAPATAEMAAARPPATPVPTPSQVGYAKVMAEAASRHHSRLSAQADRACKTAYARLWADGNANETARQAVRAADVALRQAGAAGESSWHIKFRDPRRDAMLTWHGEHPVHGQPATAESATAAPATPAEKAGLGRLFRTAADLVEQAGIPGLDVSCSPERGEITIRVPEDCGDIRSRIAAVDRLAAITGGQSAPVPRFGEGCDWISAAGQFAGHSVQIFTPSRPQPGRPPRTEQALSAGRQTVSSLIAEPGSSTRPDTQLAGLAFPVPLTTAGQTHGGSSDALQRPDPALNRAVRAVRARLAKSAARPWSLR